MTSQREYYDMRIAELKKMLAEYQVSAVKRAEHMDTMYGPAGDRSVDIRIHLDQDIEKQIRRILYYYTPSKEKIDFPEWPQVTDEQREVVKKVTHQLEEYNESSEDDGWEKVYE